MDMQNTSTNTSAAPPPVEIRVRQGDPVARLRYGQEVNVVLLERIASIALGFGLLTLLGRRLFIVGGMAVLGLYLIYRGLAGYCPIYAGVQGWQGSDRLAAGGGNVPAGYSHAAEEDLHRELRRERQRDKVDERSWESFPASDSPA